MSRLFVAALLLLPLLYMFAAAGVQWVSREASASASMIFETPLIGASLLLALCTATISIAGAFPLALAYFGLSDSWKRRSYLLVLLALFAVTPIGYLLIVEEWKLFSGGSALSRSLSVLTFWLIPWVAGVLIAAMRQIDQSSLNMATLFPLKKSKIFLVLILRPLFPYLLGVFYLSVMLVMTREDVAAYFGYHTYAEEFMGRVVLAENFEQTLLYAVPFLLFSLIGGLLFGNLFLRILHRSRDGSFSSLTQFTDPRFVSFSRWIFPLTGIFFLLVIGMLGREAFASDGLEMLRDGFCLISETLFVDGIAALMTVILAYYLIFPRKPLVSIFLVSVFLCYFFLPSSLIALVLIRFATLLEVSGVTVSYLLLTIGEVLKTLPVALGILLLFTLGRKEDAFIRLYPLSPLRRWRRVTFPVIHGELFLAFVIVFVLILNEIQLPILLAPPEFETVIVRVYNLLHYGALREVSLLLLWQLLGVSILGMLVLGVIMKKSDLGKAG